MAVIKGQELIKYMAERFAVYVDGQEERKTEAMPAAAREHWHSRWFGMIPMGLSLWRQDRKKPSRFHEEKPPTSEA